MRVFGYLALLLAVLPLTAEPKFDALAGTYEKFNHSSVTLLPQVISFSEFKGSATAEACMVGEVKVVGKKFVIECKAASKKEVSNAVAALEEKHVPWSGKPETLIKGKLEMVIYENNTHIYFRGRKHVYAKFQ